jgi:hypothetical protein
VPRYTLGSMVSPIWNSENDKAEDVERVLVHLGLSEDTL